MLGTWKEGLEAVRAGGVEPDRHPNAVLVVRRRERLADDTLVFFTSDNGPWLQMKERGGSAGRLRAGKGTTFEGGQREPCLMWWPGKIPAGTVSDDLCTMMDFVPTFAKLAGTPGPKLAIDGHDIRPLLFGEAGAKSPWRTLFVPIIKTAALGLRPSRLPWSRRQRTCCVRSLPMPRFRA